MNDISKHLGPDVFHLLYADDLQVYVQFPPESISDGVKVLSMVAHRISEWTKLMFLHLNPDKTKAIYFGSRTFVNRLNKQNLPGVKINEGTLVAFVHEVKSLGLILDNALTWESQVIATEKKVDSLDTVPLKLCVSDLSRH